MNDNEEKARIVALQTLLTEMLKQQFQIDDITIFADIVVDGAIALREIEKVAADKSAEVVQTCTQLASALFISENSKAISETEKAQARAHIKSKSVIPDFLRRR